MYRVAGSSKASRPVWVRGDGGDDNRHKLLASPPAISLDCQKMKIEAFKLVKLSSCEGQQNSKKVEQS